MVVNINNNVHVRIREFYKNAVKAHPSWNPTNSIDEVYNEVEKVGSGRLQKSNKTLPKWQGYTVERSRNGKWYFAYKIENGIIYVDGAEHANNMSNNTFVSNDNRRTDGNYDPRQQFVTDNKYRIARPLMEHIAQNVIRNLEKRYEINRPYLEEYERRLLGIK